MGAAITKNQHRPKEGDKKEQENKLKGGLDFVVEEGNELKAYRAAPSKICCPMQAQALALRDAVLFVKGLGILSCTFYTDNQSLANLCKEINDVWGLIKENKFKYRHVNRSQNVMADYLDKVGSLLDAGYTGFSYLNLIFDCTH